MRYFFDTEFIEHSGVIDLISIGIVREDGREFYAESSEVDWSKADPWIDENVVPHLKGNGSSRAEIAAQMVAFVGNDTSPQFVAYYGAYDWVALCSCFGRMIDLPSSWPKFIIDIKQIAVSLGDPKLPADPENEHDALADARWNQEAYDFLAGLAR